MNSEFDHTSAIRQAFIDADVTSWTNGTMTPEEDHMTPTYPNAPLDFTAEQNAMPGTEAAMLAAINEIFEPQETRFVLSKTMAGLLRSAIRSWTWWEIRLRTATSPAQVAAAETGQRKNSSLAAALLPYIAKGDMPWVCKEITTELQRDPNRGLDTEDRLMRLAENTGQDLNSLRARVHELMTQPAIDPKEQAVREDLSAHHLLNLANRFAHEVEATGPRDLTLDELEILADRCVGRLVGDKERGFQGALVQAELSYMRAASATLQRTKRGTFLLLQDANQKLEHVLEGIGHAKAEQAAAGYEPSQRGMMLMR